MGVTRLARGLCRTSLEAAKMGLIRPKKRSARIRLSWTATLSDESRTQQCSQVCSSASEVEAVAFPAGLWTVDSRECPPRRRKSRCQQSQQPDSRPTGRPSDPRRVLAPPARAGSAHMNSVCRSGLHGCGSRCLHWRSQRGVLDGLEPRLPMTNRGV